LRRISAFSEYAGWPVDGDPVLRWKGSASPETTMTAHSLSATRPQEQGSHGVLGHTKLESTVRYLGIEVDDALSISEQVEL
jgi:hypothetical protein